MKRLIILMASVLPLGAAIDGTVRVENGPISGVATSTPGIYVFRGIPYAAPPVGKLRWQAPQAAPKWTNTRKMDKFGERCVQPLRTNPKETAGNEDCLFLNIWTPAKTAGENSRSCSGSTAADSATAPAPCCCTMARSWPRRACWW